MKFLSYLMLTILALFTITSLALATPLSAQQPVAVIATNVLPSFPANSPSGATYTANAPLLISPTNVLSLQTSPPFALNDSGSLVYSAPPQQSYYFTNTAANVSGFNRISPFPIVASVFSITSPTLSTGNTLIYNGISNMSDLSFFPFGTYVCHIHAAETTGTAPVQLYCRIELAQPNGAIIASVATTQLSNDLTSSNIEYRSFYFDSNPFFFSPNERIVVQVYADVGSGGTSPKVTLYMGQNADSHIAFPSSMVSAVNNNTGSLQIIGGNNIGVKGIGQNIQINAIPAGSNTDIQYNNNGVFGASNVMTFNSITQTLNTKNINVTGTCTGCGISPTPGGAPYSIQYNNSGNFDGVGSYNLSNQTVSFPNVGATSITIATNYSSRPAQTGTLTIGNMSAARASGLLRAINIVEDPGADVGLGILRGQNLEPGGGAWSLVVTDDSNGEGGGKLLFINELADYPFNLGLAISSTGVSIGTPYATHALEVAGDVGFDNDTIYSDGSGNLTVQGLTDASGASWTGHVVCYTDSGALGHCTSAVGMTGTCTCAANT